MSASIDRCSKAFKMNLRLVLKGNYLLAGKLITGVTELPEQKVKLQVNIPKLKKKTRKTSRKQVNISIHLSVSIGIFRCQSITFCYELPRNTFNDLTLYRWINEWS